MRFGLSENVISQIQNVFNSFDEIEEAVLYGSRAMGNYKNGSDIDLTIKGENLTNNTLNKISLRLDELLLPYTFDLSIYNQIDNQNIIAHIERVGIIFFKKLKS